MNTIMIGIGGLAVSRKSGDVIKTMGLGSCISIVVIALPERVVGMVHIALPDSNVDKQKATSLPGYFADTAINALMLRLKNQGVNGKSKLIIKLAGGASVMDPNNLFNIGKRNLLSIRKHLWQNRLAPQTEDVGGSYSRTVWVERDTGKVFISSPGKGVWEL